MSFQSNRSFLTRKLTADELEWSDEDEDEFDNPNRWTIKIAEKKEIQKDEFDMFDESPIQDFTSKFKDHKRSFFNGDIRLAQTKESYSHIKDEKFNFPIVNSLIIDAMGKKVLESIWSLCLKHDADVPTGMIPVGSLRLILPQIDTKYQIQSTDVILKHFKKYESDDFIHFRELVDLVSVYPIITVEKQLEKDLISSSKITSVGCGCMLRACRKCYNEEDEKKESYGRDSESLSFKMETIYRRIKLEQNGRIRIKHIPQIMKELQIPFDKTKIPRDMWEIKKELYLDSLDSLQEWIDKLSVNENKIVDPLDYLYKYPLPEWLKEEFKRSEILLYQHQFTLIDKDCGGSIDVYELQDLLSSIGTKVTHKEAQDIIDKYDIDGTGTIDFIEFMVLIYKIQRGTIDMVGNDFAQILMEAKAQLKIFEEIEEVSLSPPAYCTISHFGGSPVICDVIITGPPESPYENYQLDLSVTFFDGYPFRPPEIVFYQRMFSINILNQIDGRGRLLHLLDIWGSDWSLYKILEHIVNLLIEPKVEFLPPRFLTIYREWEKTYALFQHEQALLEKDDSKYGEIDDYNSSPQKSEANSLVQGSVVSIESLSNKTVSSKIKTLPRIDQMHLTPLFLFLTDGKLYHEYARIAIHEHNNPHKRRHQTGEEEEENEES